MARRERRPGDFRQSAWYRGKFVPVAESDALTDMLTDDELFEIVLYHGDWIVRYDANEALKRRPEFSRLTMEEIHALAVERAV